MNVITMARSAFVLMLLFAAAAPEAWAQVPSIAEQYKQLRSRMVEDYIASNGVKNEKVLESMRTTPRHEFVAVKERPLAYEDMALPIGDKQTISAPFIVAYMTEALDPQPTDKVLEIGTGSGYQAAVLSPLVKEVYSIEIVESLGNRAQSTLKRLNYKNVEVKVGDGYKGWVEHAPFDKIIVTCSPEKIPQPLIDQLRDGGEIVIPVGERYTQTLYKLVKKGNKLESASLIPVIFVPMTGTAEDKRQVFPDSQRAEVLNSSFEEVLDSGALPGWCYARQMERQEVADAPAGKHIVTFKNETKGRPAHVIQGFAVDGRKVTELEVSGMMKTKDVLPGENRDELPGLVITLFDSERRIVNHWVVGATTGTSNWHSVSRKIEIPPNAREGALRIGLFGATGEASFDNVRLKTTGEKK